MDVERLLYLFYVVMVLVVGGSVIEIGLLVSCLFGSCSRLAALSLKSANSLLSPLCSHLDGFVSDRKSVV